MTVSADCTRATVMSAFCFPKCQVVPGRLLLLRRSAKRSLELSVGLETTRTDRCVLWDCWSHLCKRPGKSVHNRCRPLVLSALHLPIYWYTLCKWPCSAKRPRLPSYFPSSDVGLWPHAANMWFSIGPYGPVLPLIINQVVCELQGRHWRNKGSLAKWRCRSRFCNPFSPILWLCNSLLY